MNPALDFKGENTTLGQGHFGIIFLCQTIENSYSIPNRRVTLHQTNGIFMPIINWISVQYEDGRTDSELKKKAQQKMDVIQDLEIIVDDLTINEGLSKYRVMSPFFEFDLPPDNILDITAGRRRFISDGYWLFFKPMSVQNRISSYATCSSGATAIGVEYQVDLIEISSTINNLAAKELIE
jgi:hypothetical protein